MERLLIGLLATFLIEGGALASAKVLPLQSKPVAGGSPGHRPSFPARALNRARVWILNRTGRTTLDPVEREGSLFDTVAKAARRNPSIVSRVEYANSRVVGQPIIGGRALGDNIYDLVRSAKSEVFVQVYRLEEDSWMAGRLRDAIAELPPTVQVQILVNPEGSGPFTSSAKTCAHVKELLPFSNVKVGTWKQKGILGILHTKNIVVDNQRALILDANLQKKADPIDVPGGLGWFQMGMVVEGHIASGLRDEAAKNWGNNVPGGHLPPPPPRLTIAGGKRMLLLGRDAKEGEQASANRGMNALFTGARKQVRAITPNLNDSAALAMIANATEHADVYLVLSKGFNDSAERFPGQGGTNATSVQRLIGMAKDPSRLHIRWFAESESPGVAVEGNGAGASHAKWASADGKVMLLSSMNLDTQAWKKSRELGVAIEDRATTGKFDAIFDEVFERGAVAYEGSATATAR